MKIVAITQARYGSSRFPGKILKKINGKTLLQIHLERVLKSKLISKLIVATTREEKAQDIIDIANDLGLSSYRGSLSDVLDRFYQSVINENADYIVRITSDCPLIDPKLIDAVIDTCIKNDLDYCSNTLNPTFPDGMDVEIMKFSALEKAWKEAQFLSEREHVTPYIWKNSTAKNGTVFRSLNFENATDYSNYRITVDEAVDFDLIKQLINILGEEKNWFEYVDYLSEHSELFRINAFIKRNEGLAKSLETDKMIKTNFINSDKYRKKVHGLIPGGAHTYSKGDDQFPQLSPAAISHGKGAYVWDIDGNKYLDCSMGLTSVSLGHAFDAVNDRIKKEIDKGVNFQRPSGIEMEMAEKFLANIPQHQMIKFGKNGSLVTTAAVKIARAFTGRKLVGFPFDHPFYSYDDWFIGKSVCNLGVPEEIQNLSVTFKGYDINSLKEMFEKYPGQIACVITEPERSDYNHNGKAGEFLKQAIELSHHNGALFIIDEMITGYKTDFPGSVSKYNLRPDMAAWGKGIANGYSFCALTGIKEVMELGGINRIGKEKVFLISTTHGGETLAIGAAIATLEFFQKHNVVKHNLKTGKLLMEKCRDVISKIKLESYVQIAGSEWMINFIFKDKNGQINNGFRTLVMQEMIRRGVLFQGIFVPCFSHSEKEVDFFSETLRDSLIIYQNALDTGFEKYLIGEPTKAVFRKYL